MRIGKCVVSGVGGTVACGCNDSWIPAFAGMTISADSPFPLTLNSYSPIRRGRQDSQSRSFSQAGGRRDGVGGDYSTIMRPIPNLHTGGVLWSLHPFG